MLANPGRILNLSWILWRKLAYVIPHLMIARTHWLLHLLSNARLRFCHPLKWKPLTSFVELHLLLIVKTETPRFISVLLQSQKLLTFLQSLLVPRLIRRECPNVIAPVLVAYALLAEAQLSHAPLNLALLSVVVSTSTRELQEEVKLCCLQFAKAYCACSCCISYVGCKWPRLW